MFNFLCRAFLRGKCSFKLDSYQSMTSILCLRYMSSNANQHSFTVSYLINSCGLPPKTALSASKYVHFETPDKPNSVIDFFKKHGFSQTQITSIIRSYPRVLLSKTHKTMLPKISFFYSKGASLLDVSRIFVTNPKLFRSSLKKKIVPCFNFFNKFLKSEEKTILAIKRFPFTLPSDAEALITSKIDILGEIGVPLSNAAALLRTPRVVFSCSTDRFNEVVKEVKSMGFNPLSPMFVVATRAMAELSKPTLEKKIDIYKRWGWSKEDVLVAFGKHPTILKLSEMKITRGMDFFVNKMGLESLFIAKYPYLLSYSFEKRILPRCSVIQILFSKGLMSSNFVKSLVVSEEMFLERFVTPYDDQVPHLLKLYQEKMDLSNKSDELEAKTACLAISSALNKE
ncbi:mTERF domain-containing protein [Cephalotus follicularis]|uniref:mTERF domain-containing protein n=1 Tax=Cephalotus follicularis TaxID=3775 RepID=A0A1Q3C3Q5_CEPFO|nr:mTERF domain-containing protein [Cephalotus follicularis]